MNFDRGIFTVVVIVCLGCFMCIGVMLSGYAEKDLKISEQQIVIDSLQTELDICTIKYLTK